MSLWDIQEQRTTAICHYEQLANSLQDHLNVLPESGTVELYHQIKQKRETVLLKSKQDVYEKNQATNIPLPLTPFWGRETELKEICFRLDNDNCRLLTIIGPGGIGKTRLAIEVARRQIQNYAHGVYYIELSAVQSADLLVSAILKTFGLSCDNKGAEKAFLLEYLQGKQILIVLDNFEHLLTGIPLLRKILQTATHVKMLITSRVALNCLAEWLYEIDGLSYPESTSDAAYEQFSAIQLFVEIAQRQKKDFQLQEQNKLTILQICQLVSGNPLALELVATNTRQKSYAQILREIREQLSTLSSEMCDISPRH